MAKSRRVQGRNIRVESLRVYGYTGKCIRIFRKAVYARILDVSKHVNPFLKDSLNKIKHGYLYLPSVQYVFDFKSTEGTK